MFTRSRYHLTCDWVRGNGQGLVNWSPDDRGYGFHLVLRKNPNHSETR